MNNTLLKERLIKGGFTKEEADLIDACVFVGLCDPDDEWMQQFDGPTVEKIHQELANI